MVVKRVDRAKGGIADHRVPRELEPCRESTYQGESRMLDSPDGVCAGQARFEYPATSVPFSNWTR
jgi:hypothetical protein